MIERLLNRLGYVKYTEPKGEILIYPAGTPCIIKISGKQAIIDWAEIAGTHITYNVQWWDEAEQLLKNLSLREDEFVPKVLVAKHSIGFK